jgi:formate dehydrogenase major subunit
MVSVNIFLSKQKPDIFGKHGKDPEWPRTNSRWGSPTPQRGLEIERKWQRPDYRIPGPQLVQIQPRQGVRQ